MKPTDQIYPFFEWNEPGFGDSITVIDRDGGKQWFPFNRGMDLRTYLAGQAMQGLYTGISSSPEMYEAMQEGAKSNGYPNPASYIAWQSVLMADALIVELNKEQK